METATEKTPAVLVGERLEQTRVEEGLEVLAKVKARAVPVAVAAANPE